jgi:tRNA-dihydrouridine synthase C
MEGVIDHTMRELLTGIGGIDRCVTEFVRVTDRLLPPRVFRRLCPELDQGGRTRHGTPVYVQILGGQPSVVADNAARAAALGAPGIDLNFGCPAKTVNRSDGGAVLLREPQRVHDIAAATRRALPAPVPLSVKVRLGFEDRSAFAEVIDAITAAGASEIIVHARTRRDGYRPPAYWSEIAGVRARTPLPLIANGEIWSPADALRCREESGSDDLMLGRGALCRPDLPRLVRSLDRDEPASPLRWEEVQPLLRHFFEVTLERHGPRHAGNPLKQWLVYLKVYYLEAALLFERVKRLRDVDSLRAALSRDRQHDVAA